MRSIRLFVVVLCLTGVGLLAAAPRAFAANSLQSSQPADGSTVTAPDKIQFFFTENTDATQLRVLLEGPTGAVDIGVPAGDDENTISVALPALPPGAYSASWRVGAADGLSGAIRFIVSAAAATTVAPTETTVAAATTVAPATSGTSATSTPTASNEGSGTTTVVNGTAPAQALARFVAAAAVLVLVGAYLVLLLAWPAGLDDPLTPPLLRVVAGVAVIGTLAVIVLAPDGASDALATLSGRAMAVRLVLLVIAAALLFMPGRADEAGRRDALVGSLLATLVTFPFAAHGARVRLEPLGVVVGTLHVAGVAVFLGGLVLVARIVLVTADGETALTVLRRVTRLFGLALGVIVVSGLIDGVRLVGSPSHLFSGWHGRLLVVKALVSAVMVVLWLGLRDVIDNGLRRVAYVGDRMRARLARAVSLEVVAGLFAVLLTAFLVGYRPAAAGKEISTSTTGISIDLTGSRFNAHVTLDPGAAGFNRMTVKISGDTAAVTGFKLRILPQGMQVAGIETDLPVPKGGAAIAVDRVPLGSAGEWRIELAPIGDATGGTLSNTFELPVAPGGALATTTTAPGS